MEARMAQPPVIAPSVGAMECCGHTTMRERVSRSQGKRGLICGVIERLGSTSARIVVAWLTGELLNLPQKGGDG